MLSLLLTLLVFTGSIRSTVWAVPQAPRNFSYDVPNASWPGAGNNLHFGAFSTPFVYAQMDGFWDGRFHKKKEPAMIGSPYFRDQYPVRSPAVVGSNGALLFATSSPSYIYALPDVPDSSNLKAEQGYWFMSLSDSSNSASYASPLLAQIPRSDGDGLGGCGKYDACIDISGNATWFDEIVIVGVTDSLSSTGNQGYDNSYIIAVRTDHRKYPDSSDKVVWQYPKKSSYRNEDGTQLGKLYGGGALHDSGIIYWATRCGSLFYPPYVQNDGTYTIDRGNLTTGTCGSGEGNNTLLALRAEDGELEWSLDLPYGAASTPYVTDSFVYVASMGTLYIIDRTGVKAGLANRTIQLYDCSNLGSCGKYASSSSTSLVPGATLCAVPSLKLLRDYFLATSTAEPSPVAGLHNDIVVPFYTCVFSVSNTKKQILASFDAAASGSTKYSSSSAYMRYAAAVSAFDLRYYVGDDVGRLHALKFKSNGRLVEKWHDDTPYKCGIISSPVVLGDGTIVVLTKEIQGTSAVARSFMVGFSKPEFAFKTKGQRIFSVSMSEDDDLLDSIYDSKEGAQHIVDQRGRIIIPSMDEMGIRAWGGDGGCAKGMEYNHAAVVPTDPLCTWCPPGYVSGDNGPGNYFESESQFCKPCPSSKWAGPHNDLGIQRQTFCYECKVDFWCEGANECHEDREGIACAECKDGFYAVGDFCERCPDTSWRMILLFLAFVLILSAGFMQLVQYSQYTSATQFSKDLAIRDQVKLYLHQPSWWEFSLDKYRRVQQLFVDVPYISAEDRRPLVVTVINVLNDTRFDVHPPIEIKGEIRSGVRYQIRKYRSDGHGDWVNGRGLLQIPKPGKTTLDPLPKFTTRFYARVSGVLHCCRALLYCLATCDGDVQADHEGDGEDEDLKSDVTVGSQRIVLGKVTWAAQIFAAAGMILFGDMQSVTLFLNIGLTLSFPPFVYRLISELYFIQIPFSPPECTISFSYYVYWTAGVLMPMVLCLFFASIYFHARGFQDPIARRTRQDQCVQAAVIFITIFYVDVTNKAAEPLDCTTYADGVQRLDEEPSIICSPDDVKYVVLSVASVSFFLFYGIGIPAFLTYTLVRAKRDSKINTQNFAQRYGWLYQRYNSDHYYWEIVVMFRKFLLVFFASQFNHLPQTLAALSISVLAIFLYIHCKFKPYISFKALVEKRTRSEENSANDQLESMSLLGQILQWALWMLTKVDSSDAQKTFEKNEYDTFTICFIALLFAMVIATGHFYCKSLYEQRREEDRMRQHGVLNLSDGGSAVRMVL